ncbi:MAG: TRAM domain-containing protein, partial [Thaumarchaeota archaeon]|nr:TRAM domain-containing protein [Candidatus Calditenuaceae archaeon]MDW8187325.1 TRAM domain-containing protein [Nitrososphaerota archaeon]
RPDFVNISRFYPRPKTEAARLRPLSDEVVNRRSRALTEVCSRISRERMKEWIGWEGLALVDEVGPRDEAIARNIDYRPIAVPGTDGRSLLGKWVEVQVTGAKTFCLIGELKGVL